MQRKISYIVILILFFILFLIFLYPKEKEYYVKDVISPVEILLSSNRNFKLNNLETFDNYFSEKNKKIASKLKISEEEAFIIGNLGQYWALNLLKGRKINIIDNNLVYYRFEYKTKFMHSPYCIKNENFYNANAGKKLLKNIRKNEYKILDIKTNKTYSISKNYVPKDFIIIKSGTKKKIDTKYPLIYNSSDFKLILSDFTQQLKPTRKCSTDICKEILNNINNAQKSIDIAIFGYSTVPELENAINKATMRGVNIRLIYDLDSKGNNIYPNMSDITNIIHNSQSDKFSKTASALMHNKFYIFDNKIVITGSANLSHTDMSGFNSNAIIVFDSEKIAQIYTKEFEQMFSGNFHNEKKNILKTKNIYFSPQDKPIEKGILPLIRNAKNYIYIPAFVISENQFVNEIIKAHQRGVDVKIIADALNASMQYSKIRDLRKAGIKVKIENYAGKMHSKTILIDDKYLIIGSMNFSYSGENKNDENVVILDSKDGTKFYKGFFLYLWDKIPDKWLRDYPRAEGYDSIGSCNDGIDNDYDEFIDIEDKACSK